MQYRQQLNQNIRGKQQIINKSINIYLMDNAGKQISYKGIDIFENRMKQTFEFEIHSKVVGKVNGIYTNLEECRKSIDKYFQYERSYNLSARS